VGGFRRGYVRWVGKSGRAVTLRLLEVVLYVLRTLEVMFYRCECRRLCSRRLRQVMEIMEVPNAATRVKKTEMESRSPE